MTFYGVRGSCPCPSDAHRRYGGNTACVALTVPGEPPIVFDLGTGLRPFGETQPLDGTFRGTALLTHIHWDHVQGLPFFPPADRVGARFDVFGPQQEDGTLADVVDGLYAASLLPGHLLGPAGRHRVPRCPQGRPEGGPGPRLWCARFRIAVRRLATGSSGPERR